MNNRRLNVRFNLDNPDEKSANDYLEALAQNNKQSRNRFIVEAVIEKIKSLDNPRNFTLEDRRNFYVNNEKKRQIESCSP